jgi:hypothetical protein
MTNKRTSTLKQQYPKIYTKWTKEEDSLLNQYAYEELTIQKMSLVLQRSTGAISSRLSKLKYGSHQQELIKGRADVNIMFSWKKVFQSEDEVYLFPDPITPFMRTNYHKPAIYRWIVDSPDEDNEYLLYIGETIKLCPDRLLSYLFPGPKQQTNLRLNQQFNEFHANGCRIELEILKINGAIMNDLEIKESDLKRQDIRRLIERLLVTLYRNQGINLLNL